jgi:hypothetical protein
MTLTERIRAAEAARLAARLAETDRAAAALPAGYMGNCSCCRSREQQAAADRAGVRRVWQTPAAVKLSRAAEWTAAVLGTLGVMLLSSLNF